MKKNNKVKLSSRQLREIFLDAGADDVGFVEIGRPALNYFRKANHSLTCKLCRIGR